MSDVRRADGFVVVDKPAGITSHRLIASLKHQLGGSVKIGHAGTLDSFASGVLVVLLGRYTRLSDWFMGAGKEYDAMVAFGRETDTLDPEGAVTAQAEPPSLDALNAALPRFRGDILQAPPAYSAVHIDGQRAYERAAKGEDVRPEPRPVTIKALELLSFDGANARLRIVCSKGTYIRSLARDLALACGSRAHLSALRRVASGPFLADGALKPGDVGEQALRSLAVADAIGLGLAVVTLDAEQARAFTGGLPLYRLAPFKDKPKGGDAAVYSEGGTLLGMVRAKDSVWAYGMVFEGAR
ncbi:MAG: tRNA pseudouridine(55) synthase TruB [Spirochaetales bacterium]|nr:tRNA pseudouridine(55) synthase TruB [Spirochaetales bacterium]MBP7264461.1 tRNA pseudouridine(55) synthase TruB [Spirochaetia bacterium]